MKYLLKKDNFSQFLKLTYEFSIIGVWNKSFDNRNTIADIVLGFDL